MLFLMMISLKAFQSLQAKSILLKLTFRLLRQEQSFSNPQSQKSFLCEAVYGRVIDVATPAHRMRSENYYVELHFLEALNRKIL